MKEITFVTGNNAKVLTLRNRFENLGVECSIMQEAVEIDEIQAESALDVARAKAREAYRLLQKPVVVDDSSFHVAALGGFPGPYVKYMTLTVGVEGILKFMQGQSDRSAYFLSFLVYIDEHGQEHVFEDAPYRGTLADSVRAPKTEFNWGALSSIFIPEGSDKVLAQITRSEKVKLDESRDCDSYKKLAEYIKGLVND